MLLLHFPSEPGITGRPFPSLAVTSPGQLLTYTALEINSTLLASCCSPKPAWRQAGEKRPPAAPVPVEEEEEPRGSSGRLSACVGYLAPLVTDLCVVCHAPKQPRLLVLLYFIYIFLYCVKTAPATYFILFCFLLMFIFFKVKETDQKHNTKQLRLSVLFYYCLLLFFGRGKSRVKIR